MKNETEETKTNDNQTENQEITINENTTTIENSGVEKNNDLSQINLNEKKDSIKPALTPDDLSNSESIKKLHDKDTPDELKKGILDSYTNWTDGIYKYINAKEGWPKWAKVLLCLGVSVLAGAVTGLISAGGLAGTIAAALAASLKDVIAEVAKKIGISEAGIYTLTSTVIGAIAGVAIGVLTSVIGSIGSITASLSLGKDAQNMVEKGQKLAQGLLGQLKKNPEKAQDLLEAITGHKNASEKYVNMDITSKTGKSFVADVSKIAQDYQKKSLPETAI
jgi:hypothetical protein